MSIAQKLRPKGKSSSAFNATAGSRQRWTVVVDWFPLIGVLLCTAVLVLLFYQLIEQGRLEGSVAWSSGRYVEAYLESGEIKGHLLPPAPKAPAAAAALAGAAPTILDTSGTVQINKDAVKLRDAPNMALVENADVGMLPVISPDGVKSWQYYSRPFSKLGNVSLISVIVTGLGIHKELSIAASRLSPDICLSVSPYTHDAPVWMQSMRVQGHEFFVDLPVQPLNFPLTDPGPDALMVNIMPEENSVRLKKLMSRTTGYIGMVLPNEEVFFDGDKDFVQPVIKEFASRGVMVIFTKPHERTELAKWIDDEGLVHLYADINIRYGADSTEITQQLSAAEAISAKRGNALIVIEASPIALDQLKKWSENLGNKGFQLAPVSVLARGPFS